MRASVIADRVDAQLASIRGVVEEILDPKKRALWLGSARDLTLRVASLLRLLNETSQSPRYVYVFCVLCVGVKKGERRAQRSMRVPEPDQSPFAPLCLCVLVCVRVGTVCQCCASADARASDHSSVQCQG